MKQKIFEPARHNEEAPAAGMAAVNTFSSDESPQKNSDKKVKAKNEGETNKGEKRQKPGKEGTE